MPTDGIERGREIDLVGRALDHVRAAGARRLQRQDRRCRYCRRAARRSRRWRSTWAISAVVVDLPLVPVMATNGACGALRAPLAAEQLDVADHLDGGVAREPDRPVRRRMGERHAGREHQRGDLRPVDAAQVGGRNAGRARPCATFVGVVVAGDDLGAAGQQRAARWRAPTRRARTPRPCGRRRSVTGIIATRPVTAASASRVRRARARSR